MRKLLPIITILGLGFLIALPALAAVEFEVQYPEFGGVKPGGGPASWVRYTFLLALALTSIAAVGSLIYAGIVWMTSASSERVREAQKRIWAAVIGVALVAGSVVILRTINPDLVSLRQPTLESIEEGFRYQYTGTGSGKEAYQWTYLFLEPPGAPKNQCGDSNALGRGWIDVDERFCASQPKPQDRVGHYIQCCGREPGAPTSNGSQLNCTTPSGKKGHLFEDGQCLILNGFGCLVAAKDECISNYCRPLFSGAKEGLCK